MPLQQYHNFDADFVRTATVNGRRLALDFAIDFKEKFNREVCISCANQFKQDFQKYLSSMENKKYNYKLKPKYNNIPLGFGKRGRLSNENMNDKDAEMLMRTHPKGKELFEIYPKEEPIKVKKIKGDN